MVLLFAVSGVNGKNYKFVHYSNGQGLPYSGVSDMVEDHDGFSQWNCAFRIGMNMH